MAKNIILFLFVGLVAVGECISFDETENYDIVDKECVKPGLMCKSCTDVAYCIELPGGKWLKQDLYSCEEGSTCLLSTGNCTTLPNPDCGIPDSEYKFNCFQTGIFPDPLSCFEYHICKNKDGTSEVDSNSIQLNCADRFYYDPLTTLCRLKVVNGTCPVKNPSCSKLGELGVIPQNPSLYYICLKSPDNVYPQIFVCPNQQVFNGTTCVNPPEPPLAAGPNGKCKVRGYFYDPSDCHNYFECGAAGVDPIPRKCASKLYFNTTAAWCIDFKCSDLH